MAINWDVIGFAAAAACTGVLCCYPFAFRRGYRVAIEDARSDLRAYYAEADAMRADAGHAKAEAIRQLDESAAERRRADSLQKEARSRLRRAGREIGAARQLARQEWAVLALGGGGNEYHN